MKLNVEKLRYLGREDFRVLSAIEVGSKNHEIVPISLIASLSRIQASGIMKICRELCRIKLISRIQNAKYDGYRLGYGGYDYLAIKALSSRESVTSIGQQLGVGKESDIYVVKSPAEQELVLKIHRLGRTSFRTVKKNRDYLRHRKHASWMYMSRLAAMKEFAFMKALHEHDFPVPTPIDQNRHCIVMSRIHGVPLYQVSSLANPGKLYSDLMDLLVKFAEHGLIHGDFNEFNIMIHLDTSEPIVIDFPQMVSTSHPNACFYFDRDVECIRSWFKKRYNYESLVAPKLAEDVQKGAELDVLVAASGFSKKLQKELEELQEAIKSGHAEEEDGDGGNYSASDSDSELIEDQDGEIKDAREQAETETESESDNGQVIPTLAY